jgi:putative two-component system response regulator
MARLAERRDNDTGQHLDRVSEYCRLIALGLREDGVYVDEISDQFVEDLVRSAPLHDIGKVGIPDHILLKPGKLTPQEWAVMQTHSRLGAEAIEQAEADAAGKVPFLDIAKQIARHHHERWDGSGYPDGLAGDAIPAPARLMAVADVFDALISRRPYKPPLSMLQSVAEVQRGRGTLFDPDIVDAFTAQADTLCRIAQRHGDTDEALAAHLHRLRGLAA